MMDHRITYNLGGLVATAHPADRPHMAIAWDLMGGEVFFPHNGRTLARDVGNRAQFRRVVEGFFAQVLAGGGQ